MAEMKTSSAQKIAKTGCCGTCDCSSCSCGCQANACRCEQNNCQCGCRPRTAGRRAGSFPPTGFRWAGSPIVTGIGTRGIVRTPVLAYHAGQAAFVQPGGESCSECRERSRSGGLSSPVGQVSVMSVSPVRRRNRS